MYRTRTVLSGAAIAAMIAMAGCDPQPSVEKPAPTLTLTLAPSPSTVTPTTAPTEDAAEATATAKACGELKNDIKDNAARVAKAEKIGPPAGHIAVSAQWIAGATAVIAHSIGTTPAVSAAAKQVENEMSALSDAYNKSADAKPSQKKLEAAIKNLTTACAAT
jgi:hypothetical protein